MSSSPNKGISYLPEGTLDTAAGTNRAINEIDAIITPYVISMSLTTPPGSNADGDLYIVASPATDDWLGLENYLVRYVAEGNFWQAFAPGQQVNLVINRADGGLYKWSENSPPGWELAGGVADAPSDGAYYGRRNAAWESLHGAPVVTLTGTTYTLEDLTPGAWHEFTNAGVVTITIMNDGDEPIAARAEFGIMAAGAGGVALVEDDLAVVVPPKNGTLALEEGDFAMLKRRAADVYKLVGEVVAA